MKETMENLLKILKDEYELYCSLYNLSCDEQQIIIKGDTQELHKNLQMKEEIIFSIRNIDVIREKYREELSQEMNISKNDLTLTKIIENSGDFQQEFKDLQEKLYNVLNNLKKVQGTNRELINNSLSIIDFSLKLFAGAESTPIYNEKGEDKITSNDIKILNQKV